MVRSVTVAAGLVVGSLLAVPVAVSGATDTTTEPDVETSDEAQSSAEGGPPSIDELLEMDRPLVIARSGGSGDMPRSTLAAYQHSIDAGADVLDVKVQLSRDGILVVTDAADVSLDTDGAGAVGEFTADELFELDAAFDFEADCDCDDPYLYRGVRTGDRPPPDGLTADDFAIVPLTTLLDRFPTAPVNYGIPASGPAAPDTVDALVALLDERDRTDSSIIASWDDRLIAYTRQAAPDIETAPSYTLTYDWIVAGTMLPQGQRILQVPQYFNQYEVLTEDFVDRSHEAGYTVWVFGFDDAAEDTDVYAEWLALGADGMNVAFPASALEAVGDR